MDAEALPDAPPGRETRAAGLSSREHTGANLLATGTVGTAATTDPLLLDLTLGAVLDEEVLGEAIADSDQLMLLAAVYARAARLLDHGDDRERADRLSIPLLTPGELLRWAALTVVDEDMTDLPAQWQAIERRREELERQLAWRTRERAVDRTAELLYCLVPDGLGGAMLEGTLHAICSRLEHGRAVPEGAVVEILRAVASAMGTGEGVAPGGPPGDTLGAEEIGTGQDHSSVIADEPTS